MRKRRGVTCEDEEEDEDDDDDDWRTIGIQVWMRERMSSWVMGVSFCKKEGWTKRRANRWRKRSWSSLRSIEEEGDVSEEEEDDDDDEREGMKSWSAGMSDWIWLITTEGFLSEGPLKRVNRALSRFLRIDERADGERSGVRLGITVDFVEICSVISKLMVELRRRNERSS